MHPLRYVLLKSKEGFKQPQPHIQTMKITSVMSEGRVQLLTQNSDAYVDALDSRK